MYRGTYAPTFRMSKDAFSAVKAAVMCMVRAVDVAAAVAGTSSSSSCSQGSARLSREQLRYLEVAFESKDSPGLHSCCCFWLLKRIAFCELLQERAIVNAAVEAKCSR